MNRERVEAIVDARRESLLYAAPEMQAMHWRRLVDDLVAVPRFTDELVTRAAEAMEAAAIRWLGRDLGTVHRDDIARAALSAAFAEDAEEPDDEGPEAA